MTTNNAVDSTIDDQDSLNNEPMNDISMEDTNSEIELITVDDENKAMEQPNAKETEGDNACCEVSDNMQPDVADESLVDETEGDTTLNVTSTTGTPCQANADSVAQAQHIAPVEASVPALQQPSVVSITDDSLGGPISPIDSTLSKSPAIDTIDTIDTVSPDDDTMSESDVNEEISYPNVSQDLSSLELTSKFDQEDLIESYTQLSNKKPLSTIREQSSSTAFTSSSDVAQDSFSPHSKLGELLRDIPSPPTRGGWSSQGVLPTSLPCTDLNLLMNDGVSGTPRVFACGEVVTPTIFRPLAVKTSDILDAAEMCVLETTGGTLSKLGSDGHLEVDLDEEDSGSDFDHQAAPSSSVSYSKALPARTEPSKQQVEIVIPDLPIETVPSTKKAFRSKLSKFRKRSKTHKIAQFEATDFSPMVVDLRPSSLPRNKKRSVAIEQEAGPSAKKKKRHSVGGESSAAVEIDLSVSGAQKKGTFVVVLV